MVKIILVILLFLNITLFADQNIYEKNCMSCHKTLSVGLDKIFFRYLLKYSSEISVKSALVYFLKQPNKYTSAMSKEQIRRLGIKSKTNLTDKELQKAIDFYWDKYKVFGKLH